jgi:hypothetical protein
MSGHRQSSFGYRLRAILPLAAALLISCNLDGSKPVIDHSNEEGLVITTCPGPAAWEDRFAYAAGLVKAREFNAARTVLERGLADCDLGVRRHALDSLTQLPHNPQQMPGPGATAATTCPGSALWEERFGYAARLVKAREFNAARTVLERGLTDCGLGVRRHALESLTELPYDPQQPPEGGATAATTCPGSAVWEERFGYAAGLVKAREFNAARTVLERGLADCDLDVRRHALDSLTQLPYDPQQPPGGGVTVATKCPGLAVWEQRFGYAAGLAKADEFKAARTVLERGLADCDLDVRRHVFSALKEAIDAESLLSWPMTWRYLKSRTGDGGDLVVKGLIGVLFAALILFILGRTTRFFNRKNISVVPLTVIGGDYDGQHFVAITLAMHFRMVRQIRAALPGQSPAAPRMILDEAANEIASSAAESLAGESAGKLAAALWSVITRPCYRCTGSVHLSGRRSHILLRVERREHVLECWERSSIPTRLSEDLKDLAFLALQAVYAEIQSRRWT